MNKEKFNLDKPKKEAKKHKKKSISLINELKIDKEKKEKDLLPEEIESYYWEKLYKEKLDKIKDNKDFKKAAINDLENDINQGQNGNGWNANWAFRRISSYKNLGIFKKQVKEQLELIKEDKDFKKAAIDNLKNDINQGKNGNGRNANWALISISNYKNIGIFKKQIKEKLELIKEDKDFKKAAFDDLKNDINQGQNGEGGNANWALMSISDYKNLGIFEKQVKEKLKFIKADKNFKKAAFDDLEKRIKLGQNGNGWDANLALWSILSYKMASEFWQDLAQEKRSQMARKTQKQDIRKRPEIR